MSDDWVAEQAAKALKHGGINYTKTWYKILPDGGELVFGEELAEVGDRAIPTQVRYRHSGDKDRPALEVAIEVRDGIPVITEVQVRGAHIRAKDIRIAGVDLDGALAYWLSEVTFRRSPEVGPDGQRPWFRLSPVPADERKAAMYAIEHARRGLRRRMTDELLQQVAETYQAARPPKWAAIKLAFGTSERSAKRWIAEAKRRGFIDV
jgi:hypothetical protein